MSGALASIEAGVSGLVVAVKRGDTETSAATATMIGVASVAAAVVLLVWTPALMRLMHDVFGSVHFDVSRPQGKVKLVVFRFAIPAFLVLGSFRAFSSR